MASSRAARAGLPISVHLIATTSILIAAAVGIATVFAQRAIADISESQNAARRQMGEKTIMREFELVARAVASAVAFPIATNVYSDVEPVLEAAIDDDRSSGDDRLLWLVAEDATGAVVARTRGAPDGARLAEYERRLGGRTAHSGVAHAAIGESTWVYGAQIRLEGTFVGRLQIGVSVGSLERELRAALDRAADVARAARNRALVVALIVLALGVALAAFHGIQLARPIQALTAQAERIAGGDLDSRVEDRRRDELGVLARTFNAMSAEIRRLLIEQSRKASLEKEMSLARQVQRAMLPPDTLDQHGAVKIVGYCMPAASCGGDWWTYRKLSGGRMLTVVGDATGHGIHSAMIAATARGAAFALSAIDDRTLSPDQVLRAIDSAIRQLGDPSVLMTAFAAIFDAAGQALHYANAGHNFPYVWKLGAAGTLEEPRIVAASGNPLGDPRIAIDIRCGSLPLCPGDVFVCFSDGLVERADPEGQLFGDRRLRGAMLGASVADGHALIALRDRVVERVESHAAGVDAEDDITLVICQFDPAQAGSPTERGRGAA